MYDPFAEYGGIGEYGDQTLIDELTSRGYRILDLSDDNAEHYARLQQKHLRGQDISEELFDDFLSKLNRIV